MPSSAKPSRRSSPPRPTAAARPLSHHGPQEPGSHLPDALVDSLDRTFRRLRKTMVRPPQKLVPVPALGRQLDMAKVFACDAVAELSSVSDVVTVKDVAGMLDLEHSTVSRLLGEMEDDGLVTRGSDATDRRRTTIALTDLGRSVVADATSMTRFFTRLLLSDWSREDVESLTRLLGRLAETVHTKLSALPAQAMAEFCGPVVTATSTTEPPAVP